MVRQCSIVARRRSVRAMDVNPGATTMPRISPGRYQTSRVVEDIPRRWGRRPAGPYRFVVGDNRVPEEGIRRTTFPEVFARRVKPNRAVGELAAREARIGGAHQANGEIRFAAQQIDPRESRVHENAYRGV